jgi:polar amino acid transport system substrate-binding protein
LKRSLLFLLITILILSIVTISCQATPKITVATNANYPPFNFIIEQTGQIVGFDIDLMNAIAKKEGFKVEYVKVDLEPLLQGIAEGKYDAAISALSITEARRQDMLFSDPYFVAGQVVTVRQDDTSITGKDTLTGKIVGVETGSTGAASISDMEGITVKDYADLTSAWEDLLNGTIDAIVSDNTVALEYTSRYPDKLKIVGAPFSQEDYGIAVSKNNPELLDKINAGLETLKGQGFLEELYQKWLPQ